MAPSFEFEGVEPVNVTGNVLISKTQDVLFVPVGQRSRFAGVKLPAKLNVGRSDGLGKIRKASNNEAQGLIGNGVIKDIVEAYL